MPKKFFVYGTLKIGGYFATHLDSLRKNVKKATLNNFDLFGVVQRKGGPPSFPAAVKGTGKIEGEIHEFTDDSAATAIMDAIEGYDDKDPKNSLYVRTTAEAVLETGETETVFIYLFNRELQDFYPRLKEWKI